METQVKAKPKLKVIEDVPNLLKPGEIGAILELTVKDKDGKVTDHRVMESKCFVRQFLQLLWIKFNNLPRAVTFNVRDTGDALRDLENHQFTFQCDAAAANVTHGIIVGTGTTAPTIDDYVIETIISHDAATALQYSATTIAAAASDATTSQVTITRDFANNSGGAITVNEIALYVQGFDAEEDTHYFMTIRDVIAGGIVVADGQTLTVNYREQVVA